MSIYELWGIRLPRRHNTRRNRLKAFRKILNQDDDLLFHSPKADCAIENEVRCGAHIADYLQRGGSIKTYSAWSGCSVRKVSKWVARYYRQLLPGQRMLAEVVA